jgi:teichuronic acid biosynthesis glycosyltransferase TuaH
MTEVRSSESQSSESQSSQGDPRRGPASGGHRPSGRPGLDVVCFSLEPWDEVWRRNQWFTTEILRLDPTLRLLFAELPVDVPMSLAQRRLPPHPRLRSVGPSGRLWTVSPYKLLPRRVWPGVDVSMGRQIVRAARRLGMMRPLLWVNDNTFAEVVTTTGWRSVYDVTDDMLLAHTGERELERQRRNDRLLLEHATEVVVCSPALAESRGRSRPVHLVPNGVDVAHLRRPQPRPRDLPSGPIVLYQGTLSEGRLDIDLCVDLASGLAGRATFVLLGPVSMSEAATERLDQAGAVLLGARPYTTMPSYLQHADVLVVPHRVSDFTESLDPIKAREFVAVGRPTVATPVAGFRDLEAPVVTASPDTFVETVAAILARDLMPPGPGPLNTPPPTWADRAAEFLAILQTAADPVRGEA